MINNRVMVNSGIDQGNHGCVTGVQGDTVEIYLDAWSPIRLVHTDPFLYVRTTDVILID